MRVIHTDPGLRKAEGRIWHCSRLGLAPPKLTNATRHFLQEYGKRIDCAKNRESGDAFRDRTPGPEVSLRLATENQREYNGTSLDTRDARHLRIGRGVVLPERSAGSADDGPGGSSRAGL